MKTQEEIEKMANEFSKDYIKTTNNSILQSSFKLEVGYIKGYKQCQEDMALSPTKMDKKEIEKAAKHRAEFLKFRLEEDAKFYEECFIEGAEWALSQPKEDKDLLDKMYNYLKNLQTPNVSLEQKPVESDAVEFLEWIGNDWTKLKKGWMKSDLYTTIEATHTTAELYEQFKQLKD